MRISEVIAQSIEEGYGRYYCSTDKKWKTRKGPKQTRNVKEGGYTTWVHNKGDKLTHGMLGPVTVEKSEGNSVHVRAQSDGKVYKVTPNSLKSATK